MTRSRGKPFFTISTTSASVNLSFGRIVSRFKDANDEPAPDNDDDDDAPAMKKKILKGSEEISM